MEIFYYPRVSRRILIALLDMFNNIKAYNYDKYSNPVSIIDVPIKYGPGEKYHLFNTQSESGKKYYPKVPSILMTLENINYNSERATSVNELRNIYNPAINVHYTEDFWSDVQPAPYDYTYNLEIRTESMDHLFQIMENILPFFNPTNHLRIKEFDFLNMERDLRVQLESTNLDYPKEMGEEESRYFNATISLNVHGYMYRPIDFAKVIKYIKKDYYYDNKNSERYSTSGMSITEPEPTDYTYMTTSGDKAIYTKSGDYVRPKIVDNVWDGQKENINTDEFVFTEPQPVISVSQGVGEYPDNSTENIVTETLVFDDGTYADGQNV